MPSLAEKRNSGKSIDEDLDLSAFQVESLLNVGDAIDRDLSALNLEFLRLVREVTSREPTEAAIRFGLNETVLKLIADASTEQLRAMAKSGLALFRVVPRSEAAWAAVVRGRTDVAMLIPETGKRHCA